MNMRLVGVSILLLLAAAACGGSGDDAAPVAAANSDNQAAPDTADDVVPVDEAVDDLLESSEDLADDLVDSLEEAQAATGGGSMTLTVGDQSWTFEPVLCAFGPEEIGQEGAEFVLSSIQDGKQMYATIDMFGHSVSLDDIQDFENPSVSLKSTGGVEFITIDGKSFSGSAEFFDNTAEPLAMLAGTFTGTCP